MRDYLRPHLIWRDLKLALIVGVAAVWFMFGHIINPWLASVIP